MSFMLPQAAYIYVIATLRLRAVNLAGLGLVAFLAWRLLSTSRPPSRHNPYPPGPPPKLIIGNLLDMPKAKEWIAYHEWAQGYGSSTPSCISRNTGLTGNAVGDVILVRVLKQKLIILDSLEAVNELMERRSAIYSSRPSTNILELYFLHAHVSIIFTIASRFSINAMIGFLPTGQSGAHTAAPCTSTCTPARSQNTTTHLSVARRFSHSVFAQILDSSMCSCGNRSLGRS